MRKRPKAPSAEDIRTLEMMLDYAIVEGAALRLPMFVLLLRAARAELESRISGAENRDARAALKEIGSLVTLGEKLDGHTSSRKDR
jgi:hypothetical protein